MIDIRALKAEMVRKDMTQKQMAKTMGISERTLCSKMKKGVFNSNEMEKIVVLLNIENPASIFFAKSVN